MTRIDLGICLLGVIIVTLFCLALSYIASI